MTNNDCDDQFNAELPHHCNTMDTSKRMSRCDSGRGSMRSYRNVPGGRGDHRNSLHITTGLLEHGIPLVHQPQPQTLPSYQPGRTGTSYGNIPAQTGTSYGNIPAVFSQNRNNACSCSCDNNLDALEEPKGLSRNRLERLSRSTRV